MATRIANRGPKRPPRALPIWSRTHVSTASSNFLGFWEPGASILRARGVPRGRFWEPPGINLVDISNTDFPSLRTSFFKAATCITRLRVIPLRLREVFQSLLLGPEDIALQGTEYIRERNFRLTLQAQYSATLRCTLAFRIVFLIFQESFWTFPRGSWSSRKAIPKGF